MVGCRVCKHWKAIEEYLDRDDAALVNQKAQLGYCQRYAPRATTVVAGSAEASQKTAILWPLLASDDKCGEYEPNFS
ncbi:MAG: hypothetical protein MI806_04750 [Minwuiales bacterium]|nr:hypothetical protein [Minwuiales bacterium]